MRYYDIVVDDAAFLERLHFSAPAKQIDGVRYDYIVITQKLSQALDGAVLVLCDSYRHNAKVTRDDCLVAEMIWQIVLGRKVTPVDEAIKTTVQRIQDEFPWLLT